MTPAELQTLLAFLAETPDAVRRLTDELSADAARVKPTANEFSALEQVCHLRDIEREGYGVRLRRLLAEDDPALADINGAQLAIERNYQQQDLAAALTDFTQARRENVARARALTSVELARTGTLEGVGQINTARLLEMMRAHDEEHLAELNALAARLSAQA